MRSRIINASVTCNSNSHYTSFYYDKLTNLTANYQGTRIIIRCGIIVDTSKNRELSLRGTGDSSMLESFDSKAIVHNLCASQQYYQMMHFLTFTYKTKKYYSTKPIKLWIDSRE